MGTINSQARLSALADAVDQTVRAALQESVRPGRQFDGRLWVLVAQEIRPIILADHPSCAGKVGELLYATGMVCALMGIRLDRSDIVQLQAQLAELVG